MTTATTRVFHLPDLGEGLTEAGLVQWLVQVGDEIHTDQAIAEVETAKSVVELPSPFAGVIMALHGDPGDTIAVGAPVLVVAPNDEGSRNAGSDGSDAADSDPSRGSAAHSSDAAERADAHKEAYRAEERAGGSGSGSGSGDAGSGDAGSGNVLIGYGTKERPTSGRRRARASTSSVSTPASAATSPTPPPSTPSPSIPPSAPDAAERTAPSREQPVHSARSRALDERAPVRQPVAVRSPLVRRLARELGIDVHTLTGTGSDGAITRGDVLRAAVDNAVQGVADSTASGAAATTRSLDGSADAAVDGLAVASRERLSPLRKAVSAKLTRSRSEIPEATVWVDVDATRLWQLRAELASDSERAPSLTALVARFTLLALAEFPLLASRLSDDAGEIISFDGVNLGVAADTERGLMVPVIPRAHELSVDELDAQLRELGQTARGGGMPPERLRGSTFTLNNYGGLGVDGSAAIINHPDVAILGIGRMIERPWVVDGEIVARRIAQLSLVFDHRVCDGGYAAGFLRRVVELIEHPLRAYGRI